MNVNSKSIILAVDDDPQIRWILTQGLADPHYEIRAAEDGLTAVQLAKELKPDLVLLDVKMPGMDGIEALERIKEINSSIYVIVLSAYPDARVVVDAMRKGAVDFIQKPFDMDVVRLLVKKTIERKDLEKELTSTRAELEKASAYGSFIGDSPAIEKVKQLIEQVADSDLTILVTGDSGTGKEIVARLLHQLSGRHANQFIKVNCAALPEHLLESELFGFEKGAFTGATASKPGRFEMAHEGTIFLDEIGEMPVGLQSKLLQVIEQKEFFRIGGKKNIKVDVRIVAATNRDLEAQIQEKAFRDDLFYRLQDVVIHLLPLKDRASDIPLLVDYFLRRDGARYNKGYTPLSNAAMEILKNHPWPGNIRELESLVKRVVVLGNEEPILKLTEKKMEARESVVEPELDSLSEDSFSLKDVTHQAIVRVERETIRRALEKCKWNKKRTSELLGISYRSLLYKIKEYSIQ